MIYDMIWYDVIWYDIWYDIRYDTIYLTAIGLPPSGSNTVHIYTKQYIEQHNSLIRKSACRAPSLRVIPWHSPYNWGKHGKT